ncbi:hypothetical protein [Bosea sp. PAMC 26642]|uniref:hypothetical protein n=1 Tax=Bosea sp. (strain PAMC 26642) TaxID=1792307 RepID=UPI00077036D8|nr:hypothetical protein [Bosea sp. PAMC 26642]AMJ62787.1 hypothetical protein AXW83_23045 [Bosea sp. PAMC 26642]
MQEQRGAPTPKFYFITEADQRVDADEDGVELPDEIATKDEAQNARSLQGQLSLTHVLVNWERSGATPRAACLHRDATAAAA